MSKLVFQGALLGLIAATLIACGASTKPIPSEPAKPAKPTAPKVEPPVERVSTTCPEQRPQMCTQQYDPVCGYWSEGVPCKPGVPCPAIAVIKKKTYSNSCSACSDKKVKGYTKGQCAA